MKIIKSMGALFLILLLAISCSEKKKNSTPVFSYIPEQPKQGTEITVKYNPTGTALEKSESIVMNAYLYGKKLDDAKSIDLKKEGNIWSGKIKTTDSTRGVFIKFVDGELTDNNNEQGYVIKLYNEKGIVPGANAGLAMMHVNYSRALSFKGDAELAYLLLEDEFKKNPEVEEEYLEVYFRALPKAKRDSVITSVLNKLAEKDNLTEDELLLLSRWYSRTGNFVQAEKYKNLCLEKFPKCSLAKMEMYNKLQQEKNPAKKIAMLDSFIKKFDDTQYESAMFYKITESYLAKNNISKIKELLNKYSELANSDVYNSIAWKLFEEKKHLGFALQMAEKGVELARKEIENSQQEKPSYITEKEWKDIKNSSLGMVLDTYANLLIANNQNEKALPVYEEAVKVTKEKFADIDNGYAGLLVTLGKFKEAKKVLTKYLEEGKTTDRTTELFKKAFLSTGGTEAELKKYLAKYEDTANEKMLEKLKKEMLDTPAPQFTLTDLNGKKVSLADFKGQPVIVDFWATWCGPCKMSFPGMKIAQEKLSKSQNVKFLFINTWERVEDKVKNAKDFIKANNYPFHVLMDEKNKVVADFGVEGIPTKFIIDKNGKIRFKSVGFSGNTEALVEELTRMISMIK